MSTLWSKYEPVRNTHFSYRTQPRIMTIDDYTIVNCTDEYLVALGDMLSYDKEWPSEIVYKERTYRFSGLEPMPAYATGNYHGCAKYERHNPYQ